MKKMIIALLILCLLGGAVIGYLGNRNVKSGTVAPAEDVSVIEGAAGQTAVAVNEGMDGEGTGLGTGQPEAAEEEAEEEAYTLRVPDYAALYALHEPDEVVAAVDGKDVTWGEYYYLFFSQAKQVENYFSTMAAYYGAAPEWTDQVEEDSDDSFADIVHKSAESSLKQICVIESMAEKNGVELTDEQLEAIREQEEQDIAGAVGEGKTVEDFNAYIETIFLPRTLYDRMNRVNYLYRQGFVQAYGENGELVEDGVAAQYLADNNYLAATHILLMTIDPTNFQELDEAAAAEKLAKAQEIADELKAIEDDGERLARFAELKAEYCEDTGKEAYPDGYVFLPGKMVAEFEDAVLSLEEYQVSDPVKSDYGYHVIMRLPLRADSLLYSAQGTPVTARQ
jgi:parvulin-like peptidyl-prolyl isomerase